MFLLSFWKFRIYNYIYQLTFSINLYLLSEEDTIFNKILLVFSALPSTNFEYLVTSTVGQKKAAKIKNRGERVMATFLPNGKGRGGGEEVK